MGSWGKRAGDWGDGPRMGGPNPWWSVTKMRIKRAFGFEATPDPLSSTPPPSLRVKIENLFSSVRMLNKRDGQRVSGRDKKSDE